MPMAAPPPHRGNHRGDRHGHGEIVTEGGEATVLRAEHRVLKLLAYHRRRSMKQA